MIIIVAVAELVNTRALTGVLPAHILQVEVGVVGHVLLNPGPAVDLLVCGRHDEEAAGDDKRV